MFQQLFLVPLFTLNVNENHAICKETAVFYIYKISVVIITKPILEYFNYYDHLILVFYFLRLSPLKIFFLSPCQSILFVISLRIPTVLIDMHWITDWQTSSFE